MPEKKTLARARRDRAQGKSPSTQAGEFVREELEHIRRGKHGARSPKQALAIGLSKARRAGVKLSPPQPGAASPRTRRKAEADLRAGAAGTGGRQPSRRRSAASSAALQRKSRTAASPRALSRQAESATAKRRRGRNGL